MARDDAVVDLKRKRNDCLSTVSDTMPQPELLPNTTRGPIATDDGVSIHATRLVMVADCEVDDIAVQYAVGNLQVLILDLKPAGNQLIALR